MSRFWNKGGLYCYLGEGRLTVVRRQGNARLAPQQAVLAYSAGGAVDAVQLLEQWLRQEGLDGTEPIHLTLGLTQAPALMLPWSVELVRPAFRDALASALLAQQLQLPMAAYQVAFGPASFGQPQLAAYMPRALLAEWEAFSVRSGRPLRQVQPLLSAVWDGFYGQLSRRAGWLVLLEESRLLQVNFSDRIIQSLVLQPLTDDFLRARFKNEDPVVHHVFGPDDYADCVGQSNTWLVCRDQRGQVIPHPFSASLCGVN